MLNLRYKSITRTNARYARDTVESNRAVDKSRMHPDNATITCYDVRGKQKGFDNVETYSFTVIFNYASTLELSTIVNIQTSRLIYTKLVHQTVVPFLKRGTK